MNGRPIVAVADQAVGPGIRYGHRHAETRERLIGVHQLVQLTLGAPDEPAAHAEVGCQLALEPRRDLLGARILEAWRDGRGGAASERRNQPAFFARLPDAVAV